MSMQRKRNAAMHRLVVLLLLTAIPPASAQVLLSSGASDQERGRQSDEQTAPVPLDTNSAGRVAASSVGQVGQRQSAEQVQPMARIGNRVQNRIQSRIRNRIDRNYDPQANAAAPFAIAEDQARTAGRPR